MSYQELPPIRSLAPYVRCVWNRKTEVNDDVGALRLFPDGCMELLICCREPVQFEQASGIRDTLPEASLIGTFTRPIELHCRGQTDLVGIRFHPTKSSRFFACRMAEITDRIACGTEVLEKNILRELIDCLAKPDKLLAIQQILSDHFQMADNANLSRLGDAFMVSEGRSSARSLAENCGIHERRLRRWFHDHVGVTPQTLTRILRFRRAFDLLKGLRQPNFANVAVQCGYFDQSHMIRDFNQFAGQSPAALVKSSGLITPSSLATSSQ